VHGRDKGLSKSGYEMFMHQAQAFLYSLSDLARAFVLKTQRSVERRMAADGAALTLAAAPPSNNWLPRVGERSEPQATLAQSVVGLATRGHPCRPLSPTGGIVSFVAACGDARPHRSMLTRQCGPLPRRLRRDELPSVGVDRRGRVLSATPGPTAAAWDRAFRSAPRSASREFSALHYRRIKVRLSNDPSS